MEQIGSKLDYSSYIQLVKSHNHNILQQTGHAPTCYTHHFGCQQNISDGEKLNGLLLEMGYTFCEDAHSADFVLFNTCAVRENAEDRIFGNVGRLKQSKLDNKGKIIALCGCMVQQESVAEKIRKSYSFVDFVFGTHAMHALPELLYKRISGSGRMFLISHRDGDIIENLPTSRDGKLKAWLPIMFGCNNFCTYCIVPYVRGKERSRSPQMILTEARQLVADGYKDITLLGQNVNSYGKDLEEKIDFTTLLQQLNDMQGDFRIRFLTSHPKDFTKQLIDTIAQCEKVCNHIHLPVQSGSDRILKAMNRGYTAQQYLQLIDYAKWKIHDVSFTSDIIVGFPGETGQDFADTMRLVKEVGYQSLFTYIYSKREGTPAAQMDDPVSDEEKSSWFSELLAMQKEIGKNQYSDMLGKTLTVLIEGTGRDKGEYLSGRTSTNMVVEFIGSQDTIGQFATVKITGKTSYCAIGQLIN